MNSCITKESPYTSQKELRVVQPPNNWGCVFSGCLCKVLSTYSKLLLSGPWIEYQCWPAHSCMCIHSTELLLFAQILLKIRGGTEGGETRMMAAPWIFKLKMRALREKLFYPGYLWSSKSLCVFSCGFSSYRLKIWKLCLVWFLIPSMSLYSNRAALYCIEMLILWENEYPPSSRFSSP